MMKRIINVNQELNMNNNNKMSVEIRRISMWITPCKRSATRGMKPSISSELQPLKRIINQYVSVAVIALSFLVGCEDMTDIYKKYIEDGEIKYAPKLDSIKFYAGQNQVYFKFWTFNATNVNTVDLYWDEDSMLISVMPSSGRDSMIVQVPCHTEKSYTFKVRTTDIFDNHSLWSTEFANSYGELFQQSLTNRTVNSFTIVGNDGQITWFPAIANLVYSEVKYTDGDGQEQIVVVPAAQNTSLCAGLTSNRFELRSFFLPEPDAVDIFAVDWESVRPMYQVPRSEWSVLYCNSWQGMPSLTTAIEGPPQYLFDGDLGTFWHSRYTTYTAGENPDYPTHSRDPLPHTLVLDFGEPINLANIEIYRRIGNTNTQTVIVYVPAVADELLTQTDMEWLGTETWTSTNQTFWPDYTYIGVENTHWKELDRYEFSSTATAGVADLFTIDASSQNVTSRYLKLVLPNSRSNANVSLAELYVLGR